MTSRMLFSSSAGRAGREGLNDVRPAPENGARRPVGKQ
jgi:hypothetical protein